MAAIRAFRRTAAAIVPQLGRLPMLAALAASIGIVGGCGSASTGLTEADKQAFEKRTGADESKAQEFLKQLEAQPADQRADYMKAHPADVRNMAIVPNRDLQTRFRKLVTNRT